MNERKNVDLVVLPPSRKTLLLHTQRANSAGYLMKRENTAIVQEPLPQDHGKNC